MSKRKNQEVAQETAPEVEEVESHRGREASNVLTYRKFVQAVKAGTILPGMVHVPESVEGNIVTPAGWTGTSIDIGVDTVIVRQLGTVGRSQRVKELSVQEYTPAQIFEALNPAPATE